MKPIDEYKKLVEAAEAVDYADRQSVKRRNKAVDGMYRFVRSIARDGPGAIDEIAQLLDEPSSAKWLAHHLVECAELLKSTEDKCFAIIEGLAKNNGPEGMGEEIWLKEWKSKKGRT